MSANDWRKREKIMQRSPTKASGTEMVLVGACVRGVVVMRRGIGDRVIVGAYR